MLYVLDARLFKALEAAWDDPSPRTLEALHRTCITPGLAVTALNSAELLRYIESHREEIIWCRDALEPGRWP